MNDASIIRLGVLALGAICITSIIGMVVLAAGGHVIPSTLESIAGGTSLYLAGLITVPRSPGRNNGSGSGASTDPEVAPARFKKAPSDAAR